MRKYFILSFVALFLFSCEQFTGSNNDNKEKNNVDAKQQEKTNETTSSLKIKYPFKSGIIKYANDAMGMKSTLTVYFDDFGAKECAVSEIDMNGQKMTMRSLVVDNYLYQLAMEQGSGSKIKVEDNFRTYLFDDKEFEKRMNEINGKKLGSEEVQGKNCSVYSMEENGAVSKIWVWKNVVLKMTAEQDAMQMSMLAVDIKETDDLPMGIFEIPQGFNIEEIKADDYQAEDIDDFEDEHAAG